MFCSLGDDQGNDGEGDPSLMSAYGPGAHLEDADVFMPKKKNRKGQRQRRAKAMALEAKRQGRRDYQSINWREPSSDNKDDDKKRSVCKAAARRE